MKNMSRNRRPKFPTYMANKKNRGKTKNRKMVKQSLYFCKYLLKKMMMGWYWCWWW